MCGSDPSRKSNFVIGVWEQVEESMRARQGAGAGVTAGGPSSDDLDVVSGMEAVALNAHAAAGNRLHTRPKSTLGRRLALFWL
jgi:hypothetical protein